MGRLHSASLCSHPFSGWSRENAPPWKRAQHLFSAACETVNQWPDAFINLVCLASRPFLVWHWAIQAEGQHYQVWCDDFNQNYCKTAMPVMVMERGKVLYGGDTMNRVVGCFVNKATSHMLLVWVAAVRQSAKGQSLWHRGKSGSQPTNLI